MLSSPVAGCLFLCKCGARTVPVGAGIAAAGGKATKAAYHVIALVTTAFYTGVFTVARAVPSLIAGY